MEDNNSSLPYFLLGVAVGAAAALILAPQSGEETRTLIKNKVGDSTDYLKRQGGQLKEAAGRYVEQGRDVVARQKEQFNGAIEAGRQAYRETVNRPITDQDPTGESI
jgi:gas vesicle protein